MILEKGEQILFEVRKHWFIYVAKVWVFPLLALVPPVALIVVVFSGAELPASVGAAHLALGFFFYFLWLLLLWVIAFILWTDYYLDEWIVTPHRIIDIEQRGLFYRDIASLRFDRIQDITAEVPGLIATAFKFGEIRIQSAGSEREVVLTGAENVIEVRERLSEQLKKIAEAPQRVVMAEEEKGSGVQTQETTE
ncbi:MAG: PH domain-containing protein [Candidatus Paceibacterota bacterium]